jgi:hypothetical protein
MPSSTVSRSRLMSIGRLRLFSFWLNRPVPTSPRLSPSATAPVPIAAVTACPGGNAAPISGASGARISSTKKIGIPSASEEDEPTRRGPRPEERQPSPQARVDPRSREHGRLGRRHAKHEEPQHVTEQIAERLRNER